MLAELMTSKTDLSSGVALPQHIAYLELRKVLILPITHIFSHNRSYLAWRALPTSCKSSLKSYLIYIEDKVSSSSGERH